MRVSIESCDADFVLARQDEILRLTRAAQLPMIFDTPAWIAAWTSTFDQSKKAVCFIAEEDGVLIGFLPLVSEVAWPAIYGVVGQRFVYADHLQILVDHGSREEFLAISLACLHDHDGRWAALRCRSIPENSPNLDALENVTRTGGTFSAFQSSVAPYVNIDGGIDSVIAPLPKKRRYNLRRTIRLAENAGFRYADNSLDPQTAFDELLRLHRSRAREKSQVSTFDEPAVLAFHRRLLDDPFIAQHVWFRCLKVNENIIAQFYGFCIGGNLAFYQMGFDPGFSARSPGTVLLYHVLEEAGRSGVSELNFLQGDEPYKSQWTKSARNLFDVQVTSPTIEGRALGYTRQVKEAVKRRLRDRE